MHILHYIAVISGILAQLALSQIQFKMPEGNKIQSQMVQELKKEEPAEQPEQTVKRIKVVVTAYSSTPEETDDTPFITASGKTVRHGIVAANFLPFGTKIKLPKIYGDKIFVVEDRMARRFNRNVDIWFDTKEKALEFGVKSVEIEIL